MQRLGTCDERLDDALSRLVGSDIDQSILVDGDELLFSRSSTFDASVRAVDESALAHISLYVEMMSQMLSKFSRNIALAVSRGGEIKGGRVLQSRFLIFQSRYWQSEVAAVAPAMRGLHAIHASASPPKRGPLTPRKNCSNWASTPAGNGSMPLAKSY